LRVLVVEDDRDLNRQLVAALTDAGYAVDAAFDGEDGFFLGETEPYDLVILDTGLPKMDGISVLEQWRRAARNMPVIILTARDRWSDKVAGMDAGADDYMAKPFHMEELLARIRAQVRRASGHAKSDIEVGPLRLDTKTARVTLDGQPIKLTSHEYRLLAYLMHHNERRGLPHRAGRAPLRAGLRPRQQHHRGVHRPSAQEDPARHDQDHPRAGLPALAGGR
jgi:two-component system OmpR family response regulator